MSDLIISGKDSVTGQNREAGLSDQFIDSTGTQVLATEASVAAAIAAASNTLNSLSEILGSSTDSNITDGNDIVISSGDRLFFANPGGDSSIRVTDNTLARYFVFEPDGVEVFGAGHASGVGEIFLGSNTFFSWLDGTDVDLSNTALTMGYRSDLAVIWEAPWNLSKAVYVGDGYTGIDGAILAYGLDEDDQTFLAFPGTAAIIWSDNTDAINGTNIACMITGEANGRMNIRGEEILFSEYPTAGASPIQRLFYDSGIWNFGLNAIQLGPEPTPGVIQDVPSSDGATLRFVTDLIDISGGPLEDAIRIQLHDKDVMAFTETGGVYGAVVLPIDGYFQWVSGDLSASAGTSTTFGEPYIWRPFQGVLTVGNGTDFDGGGTPVAFALEGKEAKLRFMDWFSNGGSTFAEFYRTTFNRNFGYGNQDGDGIVFYVGTEQRMMLTREGGGSGPDGYDTGLVMPTNSYVTWSATSNLKDNLTLADNAAFIGHFEDEMWLGATGYRFQTGGVDPSMKLTPSLLDLGISTLAFGTAINTIIERAKHAAWTGRNFGDAIGLDITVDNIDVLALGTDAAIGGANAFMAMPVNSYIGWTNSSDTGASIIASMGYYDAAGEPDNSWYVDAPILSFFESGTERLRIDNNAITLIESATLVIGDGTGASYIDLPGASYIQWRNQNTGIWSQQDKVLSLYADEPGGFIAFENDIHFTSGPPSYTSLVTVATDTYVENYGGDWEITGISIQPVGSPGVPLRIGSDPDGNTQLVLDSGSSGIHFADTTDDDKLLAEIRHRVSLPGLGYGAQVHSFFEFTAVGNSWAETERMRINNGIIDVGSHPLQFGSAIGTSESQIAWIDATNPYLDLTVMGNSIISLGDNEFGMFGTAPIIKQTVTGSHGGNAALISLLTALAAYGLITDSTTA